MDRVHHGFWDCFDRTHWRYQPGNPYENVIPEYYRWLDEQIGAILQIIDKDTVVLIASDHGAQRLERGFAVNEWLLRVGLLVLEEMPKTITPFAKLRVNWSRTKVWSEGGYYARVFFNVAGREPQGIIPQADYEGFRDEMKARFEASDDKGHPLRSLVLRPQEIYRHVRNSSFTLVDSIGARSGAWVTVPSTLKRTTPGRTPVITVSTGCLYWLVRTFPGEANAKERESLTLPLP